MRDKILNDLKDAMKTQNKEVLSVIRMVKGAMQLEEIAKKRDLNDEEITAVIARQIKTRKESIVEFEKGNRQDLVDQNNAEIVILKKYMPEQLSETEVVSIIEKAFAEIKPRGAADMGKIMGALTPLLKGKADMGEANRLIREKLINL